MARHQGYAQALRRICPYLRHLILLYTFNLWQKIGIHVTPVHYYQPIPDTRELRQSEELWETDSELLGIDMNVDEQLRFVREVFPEFKDEYQFPLHDTQIPYQFFLENPNFRMVDAEVAHCMIRHYQPGKIIEIGSGFSTYLLARASMLNREKAGKNTELIAIDPHPWDALTKEFPGFSTLIRDKVENIELDLFQGLDAGDVLWIDSTHVVRTGGDVNYLYLEILPRLQNGVIVHIHDIFLPREYPQDWVQKYHLFYSEQYLLHALLMYNSAFEVLWGASFMHINYPQELKMAFPGYDDRIHWPVSFWMRKRI